MIVRAAPVEHLPWLAKKAGCTFTPGARAIEALRPDGSIAAMVGYDAWTPSACIAHMATETPLAWRYLARPAFEYPFLQAGRNIILAIIPEDNEPSVRLARHFGFRDTHRVRDGWAFGVDLLLLEMRRADCGWLEH